MNVLTANEIKHPRTQPETASCSVAVLWIDWYAYHVSRFRAMVEHPALRGRVAGIEMVGGVGVHRGLKFREEIPTDLPVSTIFPDGDWSALSKWAVARGVWRELSRLNPEAVLVPGYYNLPALAAAVWARWKRRQSILLTESTEDDHQRTWWRETVKKILLRLLFDRAIAGGKAHRRYLQRLGLPENRIGRFYDVVDNQLFWNRAQAERVRHRPHEVGLPEHYFLYVGRLASEKNVHRLLSAYEQYRRNGGTWSLVMVGGGPEEKSLQAAADASQYNQDIYFEGLKSSSELAPYYAFAGCFVLPSTREPWGLVVNEAMAAGLPVIVSSACGCAEDLLYPGQNGFVFDPTSEAQLERCLQQVSDLSLLDWKQMGRRSLEAVSEYSPTAWASEVAKAAGCL